MNAYFKESILKFGYPKKLCRQADKVSVKF